MTNFLIIHYNTPKLTRALVSSINKFVAEAKIYIFENSQKKYDWGVSNVTVFDNSKGQIVNFKEELKRYPNREKSLGKYSNFGSFKHCISVDKCFDLFNEPFILLDSDVLLKNDPSGIVSDDIYWAGEVVDWSWKPGNGAWPQTKRIDPRICHINLPKCKELGIRYFDEHHMAGLWNPDKGADSFDTGGWFYEQVNNLNHLQIKIHEYVVHFGGGSYTKVKNQDVFLQKNKSLYNNFDIEDNKIKATNNNLVVKKNIQFSKTLQKQDTHPLTIYTETGKFSTNETIKQTNIEYMDKKVIDAAIARARKLVGNGLDNPKTFQEKLCWLNCYDLGDLELKTKCCDKLALSEYCKESVGENLCPKVLKVYDSADDIKLNELPNKFILKCNHGSGFNIIVTDKSKFNLDSAKAKIKGWLGKNYCTAYWYELFYYNIKPRVYAEELIGSDLIDYKFWCFNGEPKFMVINDGHGHGEFKTFDMNFKPMSLERTDLKYNSKRDFKKPNNFDKMAEYAGKLSKPFKFVRVDFYETNGRVYLGELTFMPGAGNFKYKKPEENIMVGNMLDLGNNVSIEFKQEVIKHNAESSSNKSSEVINDSVTKKTSKNTKVVYMAITGNADKIVPPKKVTSGFDYICYADDVSKGAKGWEMRPIPDKLKSLSKAKQNRYIKTHPHEFFPEYDFSVYIDGNVDLIGDINEFIKKEGISKEKGSIYLGQHPNRKCLYNERDIVVKMKKDTKENTEAMMKKYKDEGFPKNYGLSQNCIILRYHNEPGCIKIMEQWWDEIKKYSHRDQLSLFYVFWKNQSIKPVMLSKDIFKGTCFKWIGVHRK